MTILQRTVWDIASEPDLIEAVVGLDMMFRHWRPLRAAMDSWIAAKPRSRAAGAIALANGLAESPQETRARLKFLRAGFPAPVLQHEVRVGSRLVARVDFAWPEARVAVEYDGLWHVGDVRQMVHDRARLNALGREGWQVLHLTTADLADPTRFTAFCGYLRHALAI
jgi:very-short-patch-repair endonuclease